MHFDVDVVDFTDTPLSENPGRNEGVAYTEVVRALHVLLASPRLAALTVTELNPLHVEEGAGAIERLAGDLAGRPGRLARDRAQLAAGVAVAAQAAR